MNSCMPYNTFWAWAMDAADHAITRFEERTVELYDKDSILLYVWEYVPSLQQMYPVGLI